MTRLYVRVWYPGLNTETSQFNTESMTMFHYPGMLFLQEIGARYQATLLDDQQWFCYPGAINDTAPTCSSMSEDDVLATDSWDQQVYPHFTGTDNKRAIYFKPKPNLAMRSPNQFLTLGVNWNYSSSEVDDHTLGYPNLWLIVYDQATDPAAAYFTGDGQMALFNANGVTTIGMEISYVHQADGTYHYQYDVNITTSPYFNLVCDVDGDLTTYEPC
ncbi:hypothetical protein BDV96DRAFT_327056 [Lophiotrema nucula]|uniref:Uncharacterized protein n=1 Tax=Lophiotrema nucula TaxID=690887 RepID=A0A6A5YIK5_9PLEO|nr:hypothetical protein BDV96DRAFT_327056 [Lophiotrema nucula]